MSIQTRIIDRLSIAGLPAYLPGRAPGECRKAHAVVADGGRDRQGRTTGRHMYYVTVYVPEQRPDDLTEKMQQASEALLGMRDIRATGNASGGDFDEKKKAYFASIELYALCAI